MWSGLQLIILVQKKDYQGDFANKIWLIFIAHVCHKCLSRKPLWELSYSYFWALFYNLCTVSRVSESSLYILQDTFTYKYFYKISLLSCLYYTYNCYCFGSLNENEYGRSTCLSTFRFPISILNLDILHWYSMFLKIIL